MKFILFFLITCLNLFLLSGHEHEISICAIFQNEAPYLKEWIDYHRKIGVEHFWLYNNDSEDDWKTVLKPYIKKGILEVQDWPNLWPETFFGYGCQPKAYEDGLKRALGKSKWLCLIDIDEFMVPMADKDLPTCIHLRYPFANAIYATWLMFGTSNINLHGRFPILPNLICCGCRDNVWNGIGKSIVKPEIIIGCEDAHFLLLDSGECYFDGDGNPCGRNFDDSDKIHHDNFLRINHYTYKDEYFFRNVKRNRFREPLEQMLEKNKQFNACKDVRIFRLLDLIPE